jgi:hypothetical protein
MEEEYGRLYYVYLDPVMVIAESPEGAKMQARDMMAHGYQPQTYFVEEIKLVKTAKY